MKFNYSKENLSPPDRRLQRILEMLPALTSWSLLLGLTAVSFLKPVWAAVFVIAFYLYWLFKLFYMTIFLVLSFARLKVEGSTDWLERVRNIDRLKDTSPDALTAAVPRQQNRRLSAYFHRQDIYRLRRSGMLPPASKDIYHLIIFPVVKESLEIIEPGIRSISEQYLPAGQIVVMFALEERADEKIKQAVFGLEQKYQNKFFKTAVIVHPEHLPGESRVKGANVTFAAKEAARFFEKNRIPSENVIVSCFDADTVVPRHYFTALTYYFMITPNRLRASFQPIPVYHNNIWDVPGFARVMETGSSFFQLIEATNPQRLVTFSSHSMSFKALVDVGYWPVDMISDDSAIYWKSYIHYDGDYHVVPMNVTLSMDVAGSDNAFETMKTIYHQKRRWAWGVENFPLVTRAFLKAGNISLYNRVRHLFKLFEGHVSWATWGFLLTILGWLPALFAQKEFLRSVVYYNAPRTTGTIFNLASLSLGISIILSICMLPKRKTQHTFWMKLKHALEWMFLPLILLFFSALPALDAQTRMLMAKYMEFRVTEKTRKT